MPKEASLTKRLSKMDKEKKKAENEPQVVSNVKRKRMNLFLELDQILLLERIRAKRLQEGAELGEVDKSKLIREAIELLVKHEGV